MIPDDANALFKRFGSAYFKRDFERLGEIVTEDFEWHFAAGPDAPDGKVYRGLDGMRAAFADLDASGREVRFEDVVTYPVGDRIFMEYRVAGTDGDGAPVNLRGVEVYHLRDGRIARKDVFTKQKT